MDIKRVENGYMVEAYLVYQNDPEHGWVPCQWADTLPVLIDKDLLGKELRVYREATFIPDPGFDDIVPF